MNRSLSGDLLNAVGDGLKSFNSIIEKLPGYYLPDVIEELHKLHTLKKISTEQLTFINDYLAADPTENHTVKDPYFLHPPHPLDYEWRFSEEALEVLFRNIKKEVKIGSHVVLLGIPTLYSCCNDSDPDNHYTLINISNSGIQYLRECVPYDNALFCDLVTDRIPSLNGDIVVMDPPWYYTHMKAFFWAASNLTKKGSKLFLSMPPKGTRPHIKQDIESLYEYAHELGFQLLRVERATLPYVSPPFEWRTFRAIGILNYPMQWRRGDLAVFYRKAETIIERPSVLPSNWFWSEVVIDRVPLRIRVNEAPNRFVDPSLISLCPDNILPSVSDRYGLRNKVDVWSTCNRVYGCKGAFLFDLIAKSMQWGQDVTKAVSEYLNYDLKPKERQVIGNAQRDIIRLVTLEKRDLSNHHILSEIQSHDLF